MKTEQAAADASTALENLLTVLPDNETKLAKDARALIDRLDREFKLHTILIEVG